MRVRVKRTGQILDLPGGEAKHLIEKGSAEPIQSRQPETAALETRDERGEGQRRKKGTAPR